MSQENGQTIQSDILDAVVAIVGSSSTLAGGNAFRCRFRDFGTNELPAENVVPQDATPDYDNTDDIDRRMRFHLRHLVAVADGAEKFADKRYLRGQKLLLADPTLGGIARVTREVGLKWEMEKTGLEICALVATYEVEFSTTRSDPSLPGF